MPATIIDRRANPSGKSLPNRQRFLARQRKAIKDALRESSHPKPITGSGSREIRIRPGDELDEPVFTGDASTGTRTRVLPGNRTYRPGDTIPVPHSGGKGKGGGTDGSGEDGFRFILSEKEFLELMLDDLELPDLVKKQLAESEQTELRRAGYATEGSPSRMAITRTMRNRLARDLILRKPIREKIKKAEEALAEAEARGAPDSELDPLRTELKRLRRRLAGQPFIDPMDLRFRRFERVPVPVTQAVMFCLMDVSGSMGEHEKDLAKRFFYLLYVFLQRKYERVEVVFIRHTQVAEEVDEQTFFYAQDSGGTLVSSALEEMRRIIAMRYPSSRWNIYGAQASDGDNASSDQALVSSLMQEAILAIVQYFAYIEVRREVAKSGTELWQTYAALENARLAMKRVTKPGQIYPVFRELFEGSNAAERSRAA